MSNIYLKKINDFSQNIDLDNINQTRATYLKKLNKKSQYISYMAWKLLKEVALENYNLDIDKLNLYYNENNKPYFLEFNFNISHSNNLIAVGISKSNIGIDIEKIRKDLSLDKLAKKINSTSNDSYEVFKRFSLLEAYFKKVGLGLKLSKLADNMEITYQTLINIDNEEYILSIDCDDNKIKKIEWR